jgi:hypothetical protein
MLARTETYEQVFDRAALQCPPQVFAMAIGSVRIAIQVAGPALAERLLAPFRHLEIAGDNNGPDLTLKAWSQEETGISSPPDPFDSFYRTEGHCAWVVPEATGAVLWFADARRMARGDLARPFQRVLIPLLHQHGLGSAHAALIAEGDVNRPAGLMLVGPSGSGKSTTMLGLLSKGYKAVADDCFAVEDREDGTILGHSMFGTICLTEDAERRFPELPGTLLHPPGGKKAPKSVLVLRPDSGVLSRTLPIRAMIFPVLSDAGRTELVPIGLPEAMRRFMPGLRFLIRFDALGRSALFSSLTRLVERLPTYRLDLGSRLEDTAPLLHALGEDLRR